MIVGIDWEQAPVDAQGYTPSGCWYATWWKRDSAGRLWAMYLRPEHFQHTGWGLSSQGHRPEDHREYIKRPEQPKQERVMTTNKVTYEFILDLLKKIDYYARDEHPCDYGLPLDHDYHNDKVIEIIVKHFNLELDESPKLAKIMQVTGCSREQAIKLLEEI